MDSIWGKQSANQKPLKEKLETESSEEELEGMR